MTTRRFLAYLLGLWGLGLALAPATVSAQDVPSGPYRRYCADAETIGGALQAKCSANAGSGNLTSLQLADYGSCRAGSIAYDPAGNALRCDYAPAVTGEPRGAFRDTCSRVSFGPATLVAECPTVGLRRVFQALENWTSCEPDSIVFRDGRLGCTRKWAPPQGSYATTCSNVARTGATLTAECTNTRKEKIRTSLRFFDYCRPGSIDNRDGELRCDYETLPTGSYMARCDALAVVKDEGVTSLRGTCRADARQAARESTLYNLPDCRTDSVAIDKDGYLTCVSRTTGQPTPPPGPYLDGCRKTWWQDDGRLRIGCPRNDGGITIHTIAATECADNTVAIDHGLAVCRLKSGKLSMPDGSYKQQCEKRWLDGDMLVAECRFVQLRLPAVEQCRDNTVALVDERLVCTLKSGQSSEVKGPYTEACPSAARLPDGSLEAYCDERVRTLRRNPPKNVRQIVQVGADRKRVLANVDACVPGSVDYVDDRLVCRPRAWPADLPSGPYGQSCYEPRLADGTLTALCPVHGGDYRPARLARAERCTPGSVRYEDERLACRYADYDYAVPHGPYLDVCVNAAVRSDGALAASCNTGRSASMLDGLPESTLPRMRDCRPGTIDADHGNLVCRYADGEPSIPEGAYRRQCIGLRVDDGDLSGTCESGGVYTRMHQGETRQVWPTRQSTLRQVRFCEPGSITAQGGVLRCRRVGGWLAGMPTGPYREQCTDLTIGADDTLKGRCYDDVGAGGEWSTLAGAGDCAPDSIRATDRRLTCIYRPGTQPAALRALAHGPAEQQCSDIRVADDGWVAARCGPQAGYASLADIRLCKAGTLDYADGELQCRPSRNLGDFLDWCDVRIRSQGTLEGHCRIRDYPTTRYVQIVDVGRCDIGSIVRDDEGQLSCRRHSDDASPKAVHGPFELACSDVSVDDTGRLSAQCPSGSDARATVTFPDVRLCVRGSMALQDGRLGCTPSAAMGSFAGSCSSARLWSDDVLDADCQGSRGREAKHSALKQVHTCKAGSIGNDNGTLTCARGD